MSSEEKAYEQESDLMFIHGVSVHILQYSLPKYYYLPNTYVLLAYLIFSHFYDNLYLLARPA